MYVGLLAQEIIVTFYFVSYHLTPFIPVLLYNTNLRSEWYNRGNDEGREEDLFWEPESHEPLLIFQWKKSNVA